MVHTWVLILTLAAGRRGGSAITSVGPFATKEICMGAANVWISQMYGTNEAITVRALCVQSS